MKQKRILPFLLAAALLLGLTGCGDSSDSSSLPEEEPENLEYPVSIGDETIPARPEKVVSLSPALTELCFDMGYGDQITGVSDYCDWPESARNLPQLGTAQQPDLDAIRAEEPDVVITHTDLSENDLIALQQADIPVVVLSRARLPEDIGVLDLQEAAPRFHARLNAVCKTYRYRVWVSDQPCVFDRKYVYVCPGAYDLAAMRQAAETLLGSHDFLAFSANRPGKKSTVRRLDALTIEKTGEELIFTLTGDGFLHHMVRILVGTLLEIGAGARPVSSIAEIFASGCRANAGVTVPAQGLCLMEVQYH